MDHNTGLLGVCYYALMFLLTVAFFKPLSGWLRNFKMNLHGQKYGEEEAEDRDITHPLHSEQLSHNARLRAG